jgi:hypothetical protein
MPIYKAKIQRQLSDSFKMKRGIRQGDALGTVLFNFLLETAIEGIEVNAT